MNGSAPVPAGCDRSSEEPLGQLGFGMTRLDRNSRMGTRIRFLGWYRPGIGYPSFPTHPSMRATVIGHAKGPGPASLNGRHGRGNDPSLSESLWGRARGCFDAPVGVRNGTHQRGGRQSSQGILGTVTSSTRDQQIADFGRGFAARRKGGLL